MNKKKIKKLLKTAIDIAKEAGLLVKKRFNKPHFVENKAQFDLVTDVDKASNDLITKELLAAFPGSQMLAEEDNPDIEEIKKEMEGHEILWIVDPIDGTTNYAKNIPHVGICIAAYDIAKSCLVAGVVYDPFRDECYSAALEQGAFLNGKSLQVSQIKKLSDSLLATGFCYKNSYGSDDNMAEVTLAIRSCLGVRRFGAASLDLCWVASGRFEGYWEKNLKPWDIAAGMLIVSEAGGKVSTYEGKLLNPFLGQVAASNGFIHAKLLTMLKAV